MKISEQIISVLNALCEKVGIVVDWTAANVLPYVQDLCSRIIMYSIAKDITAIIFMILGAIIALLVFRLFNNKYVESDAYHEDDWLVGTIISGVVFGIMSLVCVVGIPITVMEIIQACTIPELTVIEMVEGFIQSKGA